MSFRPTAASNSDRLAGKLGASGDVRQDVDYPVIRAQEDRFAIFIFSREKRQQRPRERWMASDIVLGEVPLSCLKDYIPRGRRFNRFFVIRDKSHVCLLILPKVISDFVYLGCFKDLNEISGPRRVRKYSQTPASVSISPTLSLVRAEDAAHW